ncbi:hypothetical protein ACQ4PT_004841 [Festuca glaucescens]
MDRIDAGNVALATMFVVETVPYTNRTHLVLRSPLAAGDCKYYFDGFDRIINKTSGIVRMILGEGDEQSVRVNRIIDKIISGAVQRLGLGKDPFHWKVVVVEDRVKDAMYMGGGWIWITRGLLGCLKSDAEVAFVLAHEVAHGIARHSSEMIQIFVERHRKLIPAFLAMRVYRRQELEADHIGIMLLAASGFDPHAALRAQENLAAATTTRKSSIFSPASHPSWNKRSRFLSRRKVMEEAMELYTRAICAGQDFTGDGSM